MESSSESEKLKSELFALEEEKKRMRKYNKRFIAFFIGGLIGIILLFVGLWGVQDIENRSQITVIIFIFSGFLLPILIGVLMSSSTQNDNRIFQIKDELELLKVDVELKELRAEKQFKSHQYELKRYYDQSLKHGSWIFFIGIANLFVGIVIIGVTFYLVSNETGDENSLIIGVVGGTAGILTNFIAAIYLKMYSGTIKSLNDFHNRLVYTNHLHYSNFLVSKINDEKLKNETWAKLALAIVERNDLKYASTEETGGNNSL